MTDLPTVPFEVDEGRELHTGGEPFRFHFYLDVRPFLLKLQLSLDG